MSAGKACMCAQTMWQRVAAERSLRELQPTAGDEVAGDEVAGVSIRSGEMNWVSVEVMTSDVVLSITHLCNTISVKSPVVTITLLSL